MSYPLSRLLRESTQQAHTLAENTLLMKCFMQGVVAKEPLGQWLSRLYYVYDALEAELQGSCSDAVGAVCFFGLERRPQLEKDLAFYLGDSWCDRIQPSPKTIRYVMRIHAIANDTPELLVAHAYVRYMGDLSGGQGLRAVIRSALNLPLGQGTAFYEFAELPTVRHRQEFKARYRDVLDQIVLQQANRLQLAEEANLAFKLNKNLMQELEPALNAAIGPEQLEQVTHQSRRPAPVAQPVTT